LDRKALRKGNADDEITGEAALRRVWAMFD
jgi:hypothetical protein